MIYSMIVKNVALTILFFEELETIEEDLEQLEKLKQVIKILDKYYKFNIFPQTEDSMPRILITNSHYISQQEYELLVKAFKNE